MPNRKKKNPENLVILDYYNQLDLEKKEEFRLEVCNKMSISLPTFYYRLKNLGWSNIEREFITQNLMNYAAAN